MDPQLNSLERRIAQYIAMLTYQHLTRSNLVRDEIVDDDPLLWVWQHPDRVVLIVNPLRIKNLDAFTSRRFTHHLGTVLQGRRIVVTNHRGIFLQVGYYPEPRREPLRESVALDLAAQANPLAVPIGMTASGPLWLSLVELDAVLVGGARRMGKTNLLHGWIAALLQGGETRLILYDGKGGVEFARYANRPRVQVVDKLGGALGELYAEMNTRLDALRQARVANLADYNRGRGEGGRLERIALVVDELAFALQEPGVEDVLVDVIARGGAVGIHPILATQRPSSDVVTPRIKSNLVTRLALPAPDRASSMVILDRAGAESIAKTPGRLLITHKARLIEAQAFRVSDELLPANDAPALPANARLSERERRIAEIASACGWYKVRDVQQETGESPNYLVDLARKWELLGWVTVGQRNERGHQLGRQVTPALIAVLEGETGKQGNEDNLA